ncbi:MAG: hypothetical protein V2J19_04060 [Wenzhouxiangella sp.]|jgi:hypothetical protein|nr:hypothetical protein [Wenzhouxiangella sp.]
MRKPDLQSSEPTARKFHDLAIKLHSLSESDPTGYPTPEIARELRELAELLGKDDNFGTLPEAQAWCLAGACHGECRPINVMLLYAFTILAKMIGASITQNRQLDMGPVDGGDGPDAA